MNKKVYTFVEDGVMQQTLFLSDEQAAVFKWLSNRGYDFDVIQINTEQPEEITSDRWIK